MWGKIYLFIQLIYQVQIWLVCLSQSYTSEWWEPVILSGCANDSTCRGVRGCNLVRRRKSSTLSGFILLHIHSINNVQFYIIYTWAYWTYIFQVAFISHILSVRLTLKLPNLIYTVVIICLLVTNFERLFSKSSDEKPHQVEFNHV